MVADAMFVADKTRTLFLISDMRFVGVPLCEELYFKLLFRQCYIARDRLCINLCCVLQITSFSR